MADTIARPMAKHVFIEREKVEKTKSGIILLEEKRESQAAVLRGKIVAIGAGCGEFFLEGDTVIFSQGEVNEVNLGEGRWVFSVPEKDVLAVEES